MADDVVKVDQDAIRETMQMLGDRIQDLALMHHDKLRWGGWSRVREEVNGAGAVGAAVRDPMSMQAIKTLQAYLNQLGAEAKTAIQTYNNDATQKLYQLIKEAYEDIQKAVQKEMGDAPPMVRLQTWLRTLNLYVVPVVDPATQRPAVDPRTKQIVYQHAPITGRYDQVTANALHMFRSKVGLPTGGPPNAVDMNTLAKMMGG